MNDVSSKELEGIAYGCDPLMKFVARVTHRRLWTALLLVTIYQLMFVVTPAILISWYYEGIATFISVWEKRECTMVLIFQIIVPVSTFAIWFWQPIGIETLFRELRNNEVISQIYTDMSLKRFMQQHVFIQLNGRWTMVASVLYILLVVSLGSVLTWIGAKANPVWWSINPYYYWGIYSVGFLVGGYVMCWGVLRQIVAIRALHALFKNSDLTPKLMHADGCMGLSAVGNYTLIFCAPFILWGSAWAMSLVFMPVTSGREPTLLSSLVGVAVYFILLPTFLLLPTIPPHQAMKRARNAALENIAIQIRVRVQNAEEQGTADNMESLTRLEHLYAFIKENYPTWPFRTSVIRKFCLVALLPLLPTVVSLITEIWKQPGLKH